MVGGVATCATASTEEAAATRAAIPVRAVRAPGAVAAVAVCANGVARRESCARGIDLGVEVEGRSTEEHDAAGTRFWVPRWRRVVRVDIDHLITTAR